MNVKQQSAAHELKEPTVSSKWGATLSHVLAVAMRSWSGVLIILIGSLLISAWPPVSEFLLPQDIFLHSAVLPYWTIVITVCGLLVHFFLFKSGPTHAKDRAAGQEPFRHVEKELPPFSPGEVPALRQQPTQDVPHSRHSLEGKDAAEQLSVGAFRNAAFDVAAQSPLLASSPKVFSDALHSPLIALSPSAIDISPQPPATALSSSAIHFSPPPPTAALSPSAVSISPPPPAAALSPSTIDSPPCPHVPVTSPAPPSAVSHHLQNLQASTSADDLAKFMYLTAEQCIENSSNLEVLLEQRGVTTIRGALTKLKGVLLDDSSLSGVAATLLQASWIMLLLANSPTTSQLATVKQAGLDVPLEILQLLEAAVPFSPEVKSTIYRNACWAMFLLLDTLHSEGVTDNDAGQLRHDLMHSLQHQLSFSLLGEILSLAYGPDAAVQAAVLLSWLAQQHTSCPDLALAAQSVVMCDGGLHGFCNVLHMDLPQPRSRTVLQGFLNHIVSHHPEQFLHDVVIEHLLLFYVTGMSAEARSRFVLYVISSKGQDVLEQIEEKFEVDAALALAQLIPADCHFIQRAPPQSTASNAMAQLAEIEPMDVEDDGEGNDDDVDDQGAIPSHQEEDPTGQHGTCTCAMCCRAMLRNNRVKELLAAFLDEWVEEYLERMQTGVTQPPSELAVAFTGLAAYLTLSAVDFAADQYIMAPNNSAHASTEPPQHMCSITSSSSSAHASTSEYASYPARINDEMDCCCWRGECPAVSSHGVQFTVGRQTIPVCSNTYGKLQKASSFLESLFMCVDEEEEEQPISVVTFSQFSEDMNVWAFRCLLQWVCFNTIQQLQPLQALDLWRAADFYQVDRLQVFCEQVVNSNLSIPEVLTAAVSFSVGNHLSGVRLLKSCCLHILRDLHQLMESPLLFSLLSDHRQELEVQMARVLHDRLITIVTMNGGVGLPLPNVENAVSPN